MKKNWDRHHVVPEEVEEVFFEQPLILRFDARHSRAERRYYALGQTVAGRLLFVAFTVRGDLIRVVSARDMNQNETESYRQYEKKNHS